MSKKNKLFNFIIFIGLTTVIFLLIFSVYQFNTYTAEIYFIRDAERKIDQLSQENKILEINLAEVNSLGNLENYVQNFKKVDRIDYIRVLEGTVLAK